MIIRIGNVKIFLYYNKFFANRVLIESDDGTLKVTVGMMKSFLEYILSLESIRNPQLDKYKKSKKFFETCILILNNNQPKKLPKEYFKAAVDVVEEIENMKAKTEEQKMFNAHMCFIVKLIIGYIG